MRRRLAKRRLLVAPACAGALAFGLALLYAGVPLSLDALEPGGAQVYLDREGRVLRRLPDARGERSLPVTFEDLPPRLRQAFLAAEDARFYRHGGVDPAALLRATWQNASTGRIRSGASTITQQLVRLAYPRPRTLRAKVVELVRALKLERRLGKDEILARYLNRVPMGNNIVGVGLAAEVYFGKPPAQLTLAECALLAALPKAPSALNPYRADTTRLKARRDWVLARMARLGYIDAAAAEQAQREAVAPRPFAAPFHAPHAVELLAARPVARAGVVRTTIDLELQQRVERLLRAHRGRLHAMGARQAAVVVARNADAEVVALAGSLEYAARDGGYNNGATARRSPGSALKPFLYALALDRGCDAAGLLEDVARDYRDRDGDYRPLNFDRREYGPTLPRVALANSLNLGAVRLLEQVGPAAFLRLLRRMRLVEERLPLEHYGLGLAIGNPEVTLLDLTAAYVCLAHGGVYRPLRLERNTTPAPGVPVLSPEACFVVTDMLADPAARLLTFGGAAELNFPYPVAWKTGTSTRYRDGWIVGYTAAYTVGVWAGNFDGSPATALTGAAGVGGIFAELIRELHRHGAPGAFTPPATLARAPICGRSGHAPGPYCPHVTAEWTRIDAAPRPPCALHEPGDDRLRLPPSYAGWVYAQQQTGAAERYTLADAGDGAADRHAPRGLAIVAPRQGERFLAGPDATATIHCRAAAHRLYAEAIWIVNGMEEARVAPPYELELTLQRGRHRIAIVGPDRRGDEVEIVLE